MNVKQFSAIAEDVLGEELTVLRDGSFILSPVKSPDDGQLHVSNNLQNTNWVLNLNSNDQKLIVTDTEWLDAELINSSHSLIKSLYSGIEGLQNFLFISVFSDVDDYWQINSDWKRQTTSGVHKYITMVITTGLL